MTVVPSARSGATSSTSPFDILTSSSTSSNIVRAWCAESFFEEAVSFVTVRL